MLPDNNNIDDLFRQQLGGHATPLSDELWARLHQPPAAADSVDTLLRAGLAGHASPPRRELWERLEDEYLRPQPRRRRVAGWWQFSAAAVLLLSLLAGGLLWRGSSRPGAGGEVASAGKGTAPRRATPQAPETGGQKAFMQPPLVAQDLDLAATATTTTSLTKKNKEFFSTQATAARALTSSTPMATTTQPPRPATAGRVASSHHALHQQPDAATGALAHQGGRKTPTGQLATTATVVPAPAATATTHESPALATTAASADAPEIIEVEVRRGTPRPAPAAVVAAADAPPAPARRRGLRLGGLLRQADHLVHGESVNLAEATGLPETVTLQARLGGRLVSRTIQL